MKTEKEEKSLQSFLMRRKGHSTLRVIIVCIGRFLSLVILYWLVYLGGANKIYQLFGWSTVTISDAVLTKLKVFGTMIAISVFRQSFYFVFLHKQLLTPLFALHTIVESVAALAVVRDPNPLGPIHYAAIVIFAIGSLLESSFDLELHFFKINPKNEGKPLLTGIHGFIQHGNYLGFFLWFTAEAMMSGSLWALAFGAFMLYRFTGSVAELQAYNKKRYGKPYELYSARTPKVIPFVW